MKTFAVSICQHYENTPIQIHCKFYRRKKENIKMKNCDISLTSAQNIDCGYSLEPPRIPRDSLKYFEISVSRHIRIAELKKK